MSRSAGRDGCDAISSNWPFLCKLYHHSVTDMLANLTILAIFMQITSWGTRASRIWRILVKLVTAKSAWWKWQFWRNLVTCKHHRHPGGDSTKHVWLNWNKVKLRPKKHYKINSSNSSSFAKRNPPFFFTLQAIEISSNYFAYFIGTLKSNLLQQQFVIHILVTNWTTKIRVDVFSNDI